MTFRDLNLPPYILEALTAMQFDEPTEIQLKSIPPLMEGKDLVGRSQTGSGKTFAFGIPAIDMVNPQDKSTQILVVCPTRELATQVTDEFRKITRLREGCRVVPIFGGSSIDRQINSLKNGARIVVGTPGRIMDHLRRKTLKLKRLKLLVLDEADEMLNMGFREDIETIIEETNPYRQTAMFSATMPKAILDIVGNYMKDPITIEVGSTNQLADVTQCYVSVGKESKVDSIVELLESKKPSLSIIFCNTKRMVDALYDCLIRKSFSARALHGDMRQGERKRVMEAIKGGAANILIATDVAARGIDINNVEMVINYDIPAEYEYYIHRIGRTARAGKKGMSVTIVTNKGDMAAIELIERETNKVLDEIQLSTSKSYKTKASTRAVTKSKKPDYMTDYSSFEEESVYTRLNDQVRQPKKNDSARSTDRRNDRKPKADYNERHKKYKGEQVEKQIRYDQPELLNREKRLKEERANGVRRSSSSKNSEGSERRSYEERGERKPRRESSEYSSSRKSDNKPAREDGYKGKKTSYSQDGEKKTRSSYDKDKKPSSRKSYDDKGDSRKSAKEVTFDKNKADKKSIRTGKKEDYTTPPKPVKPKPKAKDYYTGSADKKDGSQRPKRTKAKE